MQKQLFFDLLREKPFLKLADAFDGYDLDISGKMIFPPEPPKPSEEENLSK